MWELEEEEGERLQKASVVKGGSVVRGGGVAKGGVLEKKKCFEKGGVSRSVQKRRCHKEVSRVWSVLGFRCSRVLVFWGFRVLGKFSWFTFYQGVVFGDLGF